MNYFEVTFTITPCSQDAQDILSALAGEAGFETFEESSEGLVGYVQQQLFDQHILDAVLENFPIDETQIIYKVREAENRDWNEQWEQEGFEPIEVKSKMEGENDRTLIIHDGRHLPASSTSHLSSAISIEIDTHLAFGTGTHETTRMICAKLMGMHLVGCHVLDCGSGTGILGICALKLGAASCTAYDIDEWSVDNTRHNAVINQVDDRLTILHGDATLLDTLPMCQNAPHRFDLVMANINRNILLQDMEHFVSVMASGATLILSGFYKSDCDILKKQAESLGLVLRETSYDGDWACMVLTAPQR